MSATTPAAAGRFIGARVHRREDRRLLTGHGTYVDDIALPGMLHAAFVRSPLARAKITHIDTSAAEALPGVVAVWTGREPLPLLPLAPWPTPSQATLPATYPLAIDDVRFVGDPVAVVVADSRYIAEDACELVDVDYEPLPPLVDYRRAAEHPPIHPDLADNVSWALQSPDDPALDAAFVAAEHVFVETIRAGRVTNVPMETRGIVADWRPGADELVVWLSTQNPHQARDYFAQIHALAVNQVRVIMRDVGGGFGQKGFHGRDELCVTLLSRRLGRPVKWIEDRQENLIASNHARAEEVVVKVATSRDGVIEAIFVDFLDDVGAYPNFPPEAIPMVFQLMFPGPYRVPRYGWRVRTVFTNTCARSAYRGPWMLETTARETVMDMIARELGIDPAEIRRRNVLTPDDLPHTTPSGAQYTDISPAATLEQALELAGYDAFAAEQERARAEGRYLGMGISLYVEPTAMGGGSAFGVEVANVRVEPSGVVSVLMGTASHGQSLETTMAQVVAEHLGVPIEDVVLVQGDTATAPYGGGTAGTRSAVAAGGVARICALALREKVLEIAGHLLEAATGDLEIAEGVIAVKGSPEATITLAEVAAVAYGDTTRLPDGVEPGLEHTSRYSTPLRTFSNAAHVCTCEVDVRTGLVTLIDYVVSEDCGVMINPTVVEGQIAGGVVQGIGAALLEHMVYDEEGNPMAITFKDYLMPTAALVPDIRYGHVETPSSTPGGHKGVGEGGTIGAAAAVINAVADALSPWGARITTQPITPSRVLELVGAEA
jgi:carbon-monoxide dehydrogenase large subunit